KFDQIDDLIYFWNTNGAQNLIDKINRESLTESEKLTLENLECRLFIIKYQQNPEKLLNYFDRTNKLLHKTEEQGNYNQKTIALSNFLKILFLIGDKILFDKYYPNQLNLIREIQERSEKLDPKQVFLFYNQLANISSLFLQDLEQSDKFIQLSLHYAEEFPARYASSLFDRGRNKFTRGELTAALNNNKQAQEIFQKESHPKIIIVQNSIGNVYLAMGDYEQALDYYNKNLSLHFIEEFELRKLATESNIAEVYVGQGRLKEALEIFEKQLLILREKASPGYLVNCLQGILFHGKDLISPAKRNAYFQEMKSVVNNSPGINRYSYQRFRVVQGLFYLETGRILEIGKAQEIFRDILNAPTIWFDITYIASINLVDSLLYEYKLTKNELAYKEMVGIVDNLKNIAEKEQVLRMLIDLQIFQSKLELINGNINQSEKLLTDAEKIAKEKGLILILQKIKAERKTFEGELDKWINLDKSNASLRERVVEARLEKYISKAKLIANPKR
ncbi:MAG: tetratricopeptide repeat protein, partial [Candidatus Hodarchaeales archaeon]